MNYILLHEINAQQQQKTYVIEFIRKHCLMLDLAVEKEASGDLDFLLMGFV